MPDIQISAGRRREIEEAHRQWVQTLQREPGQMGGTISSLVEGPPLIISGRIKPYLDFEPVRFLSVNPSFVEFLIEQDITGDIIDGDTIHTVQHGRLDAAFMTDL